MTTEYYSMLIAKLYSIDKEKEIIELLEEIREIGDPIFLYPVYDAFKNNKISYISHYYITTLNGLNTNDVVQIALEIGENSQRATDQIYCLYIFDKRKFYEERAINIALSVIVSFLDEKNPSEFDLYSIISIYKMLEG